MVGIYRDQAPVRRCFTNTRESGHPLLDECNQGYTDLGGRVRLRTGVEGEESDCVEMEASCLGAEHLRSAEILLADPERPQLERSDDNQPCSRAGFHRASTRLPNACLNDPRCSIESVQGQ